MKPELLRKGYPTLGPTQLPKEQAGLLSQQLGITARVQAESKALRCILNLHLRGLWSQMRPLRQVIPTP